MKIEHLPQAEKLPHHANTPSETEAKIATLAEELISSIPTAGVIIETPILIKVASSLVSALGTWYLTDRLNRKTLPADEKYSEPAHWYTRWWWKNSCGNKSTAPPVLSGAAARDFTEIEGIIKKAVEKRGLLPHAIFIGPCGIGKSMACASLARGAKINYYFTTEKKFIDFAQNSDDIARFFKDLRSCHYPTILFIDEAELLLEPEAKISQNENVHRAFQQFKTYSGTKNDKVMFLFTTNVEDINPVFLDRMSYQVYIGMPGADELKKIVLQHAESSFGPSALEVFTPKIIDYLVQGEGSTKGVFLGKKGRHVEDAFISVKETIGTDISKQTQESLYSLFSEYFNRCKKQ